MEKLSAKSLQILLLAEHLRMRLHSERDCPMVRDRRYHLRTYPCCFVGRELVDWLVKHGEASSRAVAVQCMCILQENGLIHHGKLGLYSSACCLAYHTQHGASHCSLPFITLCSVFD